VCAWQEPISNDGILQAANEARYHKSNLKPLKYHGFIGSWAKEPNISQKQSRKNYWLMGISAEGRAHEQKLTIFNVVLYIFNKWKRFG